MLVFIDGNRFISKEVTNDLELYWTKRLDQVVYLLGDDYWMTSVNKT